MLKIRAPIWMMLFCIGIAIVASARSAGRPPLLTGRFAGQVAGPSLTSFGANRQFYLFQITSSAEPQFVILRYTFFLYEPQLPRRVFDYSQLYTFNAFEQQNCEQTLEEVSKRFVFDRSDRFVGFKYEIDYSKNVPPLNPPWKTRLACYDLDPHTVSLIH